MKPYDELVCGCLYIAKLLFGDDIRINQDCDPSDDEEIVQQVKSILRENKLYKILNWFDNSDFIHIFVKINSRRW